MNVLLVSTYELGHQPLDVAIPAGALRERGHDVRCVDLAVDAWDPSAADGVDCVAVSVPMHTATRLAVDVVSSVAARTCAYGLYASVAAPFVDRAIGGEYVDALVEWVEGDGAGLSVHTRRERTALPARDLLPPLDRYARLVIGGEERLAAAVRASTGCASRCRHCPVAAVYDGRLRTVDPDIDQVVALGARHVTFADPDFLSGPHHSMRIVRAMHERWPDLTFDITTKVELIRRHRDLWPELASMGCLFVTTAMECVDDDVLALLEKGHTAAEAAEAVRVLRGAGIEPRPSLLPFTPWTTLDALRDLVRFVVDHDLVGNVDPVHWSIRLLVPPGSLLLAHHDFGPYDPDLLTHPWSSSLDGLQQRIAAFVGGASAVDAVRFVGAEVGVDVGDVMCGEGPHLSESWFCCAEPQARTTA